MTLGEKLEHNLKICTLVFQMYDQYLNMSNRVEALLPPFFFPFLQIIGPGPEVNIKLESIKASIANLRPYLKQRTQEKNVSVDVLEILPTGESGYKSTKTLTELLAYIHDIVMAIDADAQVGLMDVDSGDGGNEGSGGADGGNGVNSTPSKGKADTLGDVETPSRLKSKSSSNRLSR